MVDEPMEGTIPQEPAAAPEGTAPPEGSGTGATPEVTPAEWTNDQFLGHKGNYFVQGENGEMQPISLNNPRASVGQIPAIQRDFESLQRQAQDREGYLPQEEIDKRVNQRLSSYGVDDGETADLDRPLTQRDLQEYRDEQGAKDQKTEREAEITVLAHQMEQKIVKEFPALTLTDSMYALSGAGIINPADPRIGQVLTQAVQKKVQQMQSYLGSEAGTELRAQLEQQGVTNFLDKKKGVAPTTPSGSPPGPVEEVPENLDWQQRADGFRRDMESLPD